jgi:carbon-monoxide dehydrogenase small subunit
MKINVTVNDRERVFDITPDEYLLDTLREHGFLSVKRGCDNSSCGVCTVLLDNKPVASCTLLTVKTEGCHITTVEGISKDAEKLSEHMGDEGADQCGYCNPSLALTMYALKQEIPHPTDDQIKKYLVGNLCRCTGYQSQVTAIRKCLEDEE